MVVDRGKVGIMRNPIRLSKSLKIDTYLTCRPFSPSLRWRVCTHQGLRLAEEPEVSEPQDPICSAAISKLPWLLQNMVHGGYSGRSSSGSQSQPSSSRAPLIDDVSLVHVPPILVDHTSQKPTQDAGSSQTGTRILIRIVYIDNRPTRFEPQEVVHDIKNSLLQHLPGLVAQWKEYPKEVIDRLWSSFTASNRFATTMEKHDARKVWQKVAANRFADMLHNMKTTAKKVSGEIDDPLQWKGHGPITIRRDYWEGMCNKWAGDAFRNRSAKAAQNRAKMPEAHLHTGGFRTFGSHQKKMEAEKGGIVPYKDVFVETHKRKTTGEFVSEKESYEQQMVLRYGDDSTQHSPFDPAAWVTATGEPKKGCVFGFGSNMNTTPVIASCSLGPQSSPANINSQRPNDPAMSWDGVCQRLEDKM